MKTKTKMILQASITFIVLLAGSGVIPASMGIAEAFQQPANSQLEAQHLTHNGMPEDFIFASNYTWIGRD